jgi:hypothetical protein
MYKAEQFQALTKQYEERQLQKTKRIQEDIKLVEDALENLYIKIQSCIDKEINLPKYAEVNKILEKAVSDDLILNQGFLLDITNDKHTRIYYNKSDFDNKNSSNHKSLSMNKPHLSQIKLHENINKKENNLKTPHTKEEADDNIIKLFKSLFGDDAEIKYYRGGF